MRRHTRRKNRKNPGRDYIAGIMAAAPLNPIQRLLTELANQVLRRCAKSDQTDGGSVAHCSEIIEERISAAFNAGRDAGLDLAAMVAREMGHSHVAAGIEKLKEDC